MVLSHFDDFTSLVLYKETKWLPFLIKSMLEDDPRRLSFELQHVHTELDEALNELKNTDEQCKKAMMDAARLAEELQAEQEHSQNLERQRKGLESQMKVPLPCSLFISLNVSVIFC